MADSVEAEGPSIDEAISRALRQLGVGRERADIEILANATRGLLGLGAHPAKVRATVRPPLAVATEPAAYVSTASDERDRSHGSAETSGAPPPGDRPSNTDRAKSMLADIVRLIGIEATIDVVEGPGAVRLNIRGDATGLLIGRRGQTLDAIEHVLNRAMTQEEEAQGRLVVDAEDYRRRRRESLEELARNTAERVRRAGRAIPLSPLSPRDRRTIHVTLQDDPGVTTHSTGDGFYRRLIVAPSAPRRVRNT